MPGQRVKQGSDSLLIPFLDSSDETTALMQLDRLIGLAAPTIKKITAWSRDPEDAFQKTAQLLVEQLWEVKANPQRRTIGNYLRYVKVVASHVAKGQFRDEYPQRRRLVDSMRHTLSANCKFQSWRNDTGENLWGLASWRNDQNNVGRSARLGQVLDSPRVLHDVLQSNRDLQNLDNEELLTEIFNWVDHSIRFDDLVKIICSIKRVELAQIVTPDLEGDRQIGEYVRDSSPRPDEMAEWGEFLGNLWSEIEQLPRLQRSAYLLNFTAADGQLELFWTYGIASIREIGAALELTDEHFCRAWKEVSLSDSHSNKPGELKCYDEKFALLWQYLPLSDANIGKILGIERQKVINLRKAAADRLSRRMTQRVQPKRSAARF